MRWCFAFGVMRIHSSSFRERLLARRVLLLLEREPLLLLVEPRRVVALERDAAAAVDLEDPARDVVEEVAIMGDGDDGAGVLAEEALEPGDRLGVEMVRRLVEQQQVGRREQQTAERDAAALAARERPDVGVAGRQAQGVHRLVEVAVEAPGVGRVDAVLQLAHLGEQLVHAVGGVGVAELHRDRVEAIEHLAGRADAVLDVAAHVLRLVELGSCER